MCLHVLSGLLKVAFTVLVTFAIVWWPFLQNMDLFKQVLIRVFPLDRGLFEDKVSNFWCSFNIAFKLKAKYDQQTLAMASTALTLLSSLPTNLLLFLRPSKANFIGALLNTSLAFFMFSYQVHEKSILLAAFPALMALIGLQEDPALNKVRLLVEKGPQVEQSLICYSSEYALLVNSRF